MLTQEVAVSGCSHGLGQSSHGLGQTKRGSLWINSRVVIPPFDGPFPGATLGATSGVTTPSKISPENQAVKCRVRRVSPIFFVVYVS